MAQHNARDSLSSSLSSVDFGGSGPNFSTSYDATASSRGDQPHAYSSAQNGSHMTNYQQPVGRKPSINSRRRNFSDSGGHGWQRKSLGERSHSFDAGTSMSSVGSSFSSAFSADENIQRWMEDYEATDCDTTLVPDERQNVSPSRKGTLSKANSTEDDLSIGAEAKLLSQFVLSNEEKIQLFNKRAKLQRVMTNSELLNIAGHCRKGDPIAGKRERLIKGESWNNSCETDTSCFSINSVNDLLCAVNDPETTLLELGFGRQTENVLERIPSRFLQDSDAQGISVDRFLSELEEKERGWGFSLKGGLLGLERFLSQQFSSAGLFTPPQTRSPLTRSPIPTFELSSAPPKLDEQFQSSQEINGTPIIHPSAVLPNISQQSVLPNYCTSEKKVVSWSETKITEQQNELCDRTRDGRLDQLNGKMCSQNVEMPGQDEYENGVGENQEKLDDNKKNRGNRPRLQLPESTLTPVHEEGESQVPSNRSSVDLPSISNEDDVCIKDREEDQSAITTNYVEDVFTATNTNLDAAEPGETLQDYVPPEMNEPLVIDVNVPMQSASPKRLDLEKGHLLDLKKNAQDSFEIEEISNSEAQGDDSMNTSHPEGKFLHKGHLARNESCQSDSSGFADEGTESISPNSLPQLPPSSNAHPPTNLQDVSEQLMQKNLDFEEALCSKHNVPTEKNNNERLDSFYQVNPAENLSFVEHYGREITDSHVRRPRSGSYPSLNLREHKEHGPANMLEILESLQSNIRYVTSEMKEKDSQQRTVSTKRPPLFRLKTVDPDRYSFDHSCDLVQESPDFEEDKVEEMVFESAIAPSEYQVVPKSEAKSEETATQNLKEDVERLDSEDASLTPIATRTADLVGHYLGFDHQAGSEQPSVTARTVEFQREVQDLKLLQRSLYQYKQELWELEEISDQIRAQPDSQRSVEYSRGEMESLARLRMQVKEEVDKMDANLQARIRETIERRSSMENLSDRYSHWSFCHIDVLNKMIALLKEQSSFRHLLTSVKTSNQVLEQPPEEGKEVDRASFVSEDIYQTLSRQELIRELVNTQLELARLKVMAKAEMAAAIQEMKTCIAQDIRQEVQGELRLMQWQIQDRDAQIDELKSHMTSTKPDEEKQVEEKLNT